MYRIETFLLNRQIGDDLLKDGFLCPEQACIPVKLQNDTFFLIFK